MIFPAHNLWSLSRSATGTSAAFYINTNGHLVVYNNTTPVELTAVQLQTNTWIQFDIYCDYDLQQWGLSINKTNIADKLGFYSLGTEVKSLVLENASASVAYIDSLDIGNQSPFAETNNPSPSIRVTEYYITTGDFSETSATLTLDQDLADDYFILVRGSRTGDGASYPDNNYARVIAVPDGKGDLAASGAGNRIMLGRYAADLDWEGVVTVVECGHADSVDGFKLVDIVETSLTGTFGTDTSVVWSNVSQVVLFGGYRGGGASLAAETVGYYQGSSVYVRLYPSSTNTLNWSRNAAGETLVNATVTTFVVEWGSQWGIQHVNVAGSNGGEGADASSEYTTAVISGVIRSNSWIWATGTRADAGIGDCAEACLVTLGNGVSQNVAETNAAVGSEYTDAYDFDVYVLTHPAIAVDYRFVADGNAVATDVAVAGNAAAVGARFAWMYNSCDGTGSAHPRSLFWSRYTGNSEVTISRGYGGMRFPAWVQGIDLSGLDD